MLQIKDDLKRCNIDITDEDISNMKKEKFKSIVMKSICKLLEEYLTKQMEKDTKSENLCISDNMQNYLVNLNTSVKEKKLLFLLRSRMYPVKMNFQQMYSDLQCSLCSSLAEESQEHLWVCEEVVQDDELKKCLVNKQISYSDIYGPPNKQTEAIKIWSAIDKIWKSKLKAKDKQT